MESKALVSMLFVPASRIDRIEKAVATGASAVIVDLEDAVAEDQKGSARRALRAFMESYEGPGFYVRVNAVDTRWFEEDLVLCAECASVIGVLLPKTESAEDVAKAFVIGKPILPLIESAVGLLALQSIARAPGVERLSYGGLDLSQDLGIDIDTEGGQTMLDQSRYQLVICSKAFGLQAPIETVLPRFNDDQAVLMHAQRARAMGFAGMLCIHPRQVAGAQRGFAPSRQQVEWAESVLSMAETEQGAFSFEGRMVDAPVIEKARALMAAAAECNIL